MARKWTGSCHVLPESMRQLAIEFANRASETNDSYLADHAYTLSEWSDAVAELYLLVVECVAGKPHGFECGIAPDGSVSS